MRRRLVAEGGKDSGGQFLGSGYMSKSTLKKVLETGLSENFKVGHRFIVEVGGLFCHLFLQESEKQSQPRAILTILKKALCLLLLLSSQVLPII